MTVLTGIWQTIHSCDQKSKPAVNNCCNCTFSDNRATFIFGT